MDAIYQGRIMRPNPPQPCNERHSEAQGQKVLLGQLIGVWAYWPASPSLLEWGSKLAKLAVWPLPCDYRKMKAWKPHPPTMLTNAPHTSLRIQRPPNCKQALPYSGDVAQDPNNTLNWRPRNCVNLISFILIRGAFCLIFIALCCVVSVLNTSQLFQFITFRRAGVPIQKSESPLRIQYDYFVTRYTPSRGV